MNSPSGDGPAGSLSFLPFEPNPQGPPHGLAASKTKATSPSFPSAASRQKASPPNRSRDKRGVRHRDSSFIIHRRKSPACWLQVQQPEYRIKKKGNREGKKPLEVQSCKQKNGKRFPHARGGFFFFCKYHAKQAAGVP